MRNPNRVASYLVAGILVIVAAGAALILGAIFGFTPYDRDHMMYQTAATVRLVEFQSTIGSGVVVRPGIVLTAAHLTIDGVEEGMVGNWEVAEVLYLDIELDLMVLSVPGIECPCATLASADPFFLEELLAIGYPMGFGILVVTEGRMQGTLENGLYLTTAPITMGVSGGGAFNEKGELAGIVLGVTVHLAVGPGMAMMYPLFAETNYLSQIASLDHVKEVLLAAKIPVL